jgi:hypothetical protein
MMTQKIYGLREIEEMWNRENYVRRGLGIYKGHRAVQ